MKTLKLTHDIAFTERIALNGLKKIQVIIMDEPCNFRITNFTQSWSSSGVISESKIIDMDALETDWKPDDPNYMHFYIEFSVDKQPTTIQYLILPRQ